jgi:hypothetical protein
MPLRRFHNAANNWLNAEELVWILRSRNVNPYVPCYYELDLLLAEARGSIVGWGTTLQAGR